MEFVPDRLVLLKALLGRAAPRLAAHSELQIPHFLVILHLLDPVLASHFHLLVLLLPFPQRDAFSSSAEGEDCLGGISQKQPVFGHRKNGGPDTKSLLKSLETDPLHPPSVWLSSGEWVQMWKHPDWQSWGYLFTKVSPVPNAEPGIQQALNKCQSVGGYDWERGQGKLSGKREQDPMQKPSAGGSYLQF
jgi:hypothetical protein